MINIKNAQFTRVKTALSTMIKSSGTIEELPTSPDFPYLSFVQKDNPQYTRSQTFNSKENHVQPMIQLDVYTANPSDTMYKCEQIMDLADSIMIADGWGRIFGPQPTVKASSYNRLTARYQGIVKQNAPNDYTVI